MIWCRPIEQSYFTLRIGNNNSAAPQFLRDRQIELARHGAVVRYQDPRLDRNLHGGIGEHVHLHERAGVGQDTGIGHDHATNRFEGRGKIRFIGDSINVSD